MVEAVPGRPRVLLVAGEASGDLHGGFLLQALRRRLPRLEAVGVGGDQLRAAGLSALADVRHLSAVGLVEILGSLRRHMVPSACLCMAQLPLLFVITQPWRWRLLRPGIPNRPS